MERANGKQAATDFTPIFYDCTGAGKSIGCLASHQLDLRYIGIKCVLCGDFEGN